MSMRTTIFLDDQLGKSFQEAARLQGKSLSAFLAEAGRRCLEQDPLPAPAFLLLTRGGTGPLPGVTLDRANALIATEDEQRFVQ